MSRIGDRCRGLGGEFGDPLFERGFCGRKLFDPDLRGGQLRGEVGPRRLGGLGRETCILRRKLGVGGAHFFDRARELNKFALRFRRVCCRGRARNRSAEFAESFLSLTQLAAERRELDGRALHLVVEARIVLRERPQAVFQRDALRRTSGRSGRRRSLTGRF